MALNDDELATLNRLKYRLDRDTRGYQGTLGLRALDAYYCGEQRLRQLGLAVPEELREFVTIVGWPGTYADAIEERLDVEGFRLGGKADVDDQLWSWWQANDLDDGSQMTHVDSLVFPRGYVSVGTRAEGDGDPDIPLIAAESPLQMTHEWSNRQRRVTAAARFYTDGYGSQKTTRAKLILPNVTIPVTRGPRGWIEDENDDERDEHNLDEVLVEPFVNRRRTGDPYGRSEFLRIIMLTDAAARALTNAQVATEVMALPQRFAAGMTEADFKDASTGELLTQWEAYFGAVWATANKDAKFGQFSAADLKNFSGIVEHYSKLVAGLTGLPMRYLGQLTDNPPSADGIRADEGRLVKTCERKQRTLGSSWERVMRLGQRVVDPDAPVEDLAKLETVWRDPSTPTRAQASDAAVKLYNSDRPIISRQQAQRDLGYGPEQIKQMNDELDGETADQVTGLNAAARRIIDNAKNGGAGGDDADTGSGD